MVIAAEFQNIVHVPLYIACLDHTGIWVCLGATAFLHVRYHDMGAVKLHKNFDSRHKKQNSFLHLGQAMNLHPSWLCSTTYPQVGHARRLGTSLPLSVISGASLTEDIDGCWQLGLPHFTPDVVGPDHSSSQFQQNSYLRPFLLVQIMQFTRRFVRSRRSTNERQPAHSLMS